MFEEDRSSDQISLGWWPVKTMLSAGIGEMFSIGLVYSRSGNFKQESRTEIYQEVNKQRIDGRF